MTCRHTSPRRRPEPPTEAGSRGPEAGGAGRPHAPPPAGRLRTQTRAAWGRPPGALAEKPSSFGGAVDVLERIIRLLADARVFVRISVTECDRKSRIIVA